MVGDDDGGTSGLGGGGGDRQVMVWKAVGLWKKVDSSRNY